MQVTQYTEAIPVDQLKVGDIILNHVSWNPLTYISSIKKCSAAQGTRRYSKFNTKRLGDSRKDRVLDYFNSYNHIEGHAVDFDNKNVTVIRIDDTKELAKVVASWKYIVQCLSNADSLYRVCATAYNTPNYYGISSFIEVLGCNSSQPLLEIFEDLITDSIRDSIKQSILIEELGLESVDQYKEFTMSHAREVAHLILRGESVLDIRNRVATWKLACTEKKEAIVRMQQAFDLSK